MDPNSTWGAMLVGWLLLAPLITIVVSSRWGGGETAMTYGTRRQMARDEEAAAVQERISHPSTDRTFAEDSMRGPEYRDRRDPRDPRDQLRH